MQYEEQVKVLRDAGFTVLYHEDISIYNGSKWVLLVSQAQ